MSMCPFFIGAVVRWGKVWALAGSDAVGTRPTPDRRETGALPRV